MKLHERIEALFIHLGIERAHLMGGGFVSELSILCREHSELVASLGLICPMSLSRNADEEFTMPFLVVTGDHGRAAQIAGETLGRTARGHHSVIDDYEPMLWSDVTEEHKKPVLDAVTEFLEVQPILPAVSNADTTGVVAEIPFRAMGAGQPLVLFPIGLSSTQWEPIIAELATHYRLILISGAHVEPTSNLEERAVNPGHRAMVHYLFNHMDLSAGQQVLEIGCGSGSISRMIAGRLGSPGLTAGDINHFLLNEARMLTAAAGLTNLINFEMVDAHQLPFENERYDRTVSVTMLEEVDADTALSELYRVTKPGGRVGVMTRCIDIPPLLNLDLPNALMAKARSGLPTGGCSPNGCADSSLYDRMARAGLTDIRCLPQYNTLAHQRPMTMENFFGVFDSDERRAVEMAIEKAGEGFFIGMPFHSAVGNKN